MLRSFLCRIGLHRIDWLPDMGFVGDRYARKGFCRYCGHARLRST